MLPVALTEVNALQELLNENIRLGFGSLWDTDTKGWQDAMPKLLRCTTCLNSPR